MPIGVSVSKQTVQWSVNNHKSWTEPTQLKKTENNSKNRQGRCVEATDWKNQPPHRVAALLKVFRSFFQERKAGHTSVKPSYRPARRNKNYESQEMLVFTSRFNNARTQKTNSHMKLSPKIQSTCTRTPKYTLAIYLSKKRKQRRHNGAKKNLRKSIFHRPLGSPRIGGVAQFLFLGPTLGRVEENLLQLRRDE